jgi:hypothetical protein
MTKRKPMTEQQWLTEESAYVMLQHLHQHHNVARMPGGQRRLRLFRCACCRSAWELFTDERCRLAVEVAERHADGTATRAELAAARAAAGEVDRATERQMHEAAQLHAHGSAPWRDAFLSHSIATAAYWTAMTQFNVRMGHIVTMYVQSARAAQVHEGPASPQAAAVRSAEERLQADLLRDIFGNPFRQPAAPEPAILAWNHRTVIRIAQEIYEDRAFDRLPVLADALLEAGCVDEELLAHCRSGRPHARGCWAVDLLTARQ